MKASLALAVLRPLFFLQGWFAIWLLPAVFVAMTDSIRAAGVAIPWGVFILYMYRKIQNDGRATITENFPGVIQYRVDDQVHFKLLRLNAILAGIVLFGLLIHDHLTDYFL